MSVDLMGKNDGDVRHVQGWRRDVEDRRGRLGRSDGNQVQGDAERYDKPHGIDRSVRIFRDLGKVSLEEKGVSGSLEKGEEVQPLLGEGQSFIACKCVRHPRVR